MSSQILELRRNSLRLHVLVFVIYYGTEFQNSWSNFRIRGRWLDLSDSIQSPLVVYCEHYTEYPGSIYDGRFL